jgi:hypothetical protein
MTKQVGIVARGNQVSKSSAASYADRPHLRCPTATLSPSTPTSGTDPAVAARLFSCGAAPARVVRHAKFAKEAFGLEEMELLYFDSLL